MAGTNGLSSAITKIVRAHSPNSYLTLIACWLQFPIQFRCGTQIVQLEVGTPSSGSEVSLHISTSSLPPMPTTMTPKNPQPKNHHLVEMSRAPPNNRRTDWWTDFPLRQPTRSYYEPHLTQPYVPWQRTWTHPTDLQHIFDNQLAWPTYFGSMFMESLSRKGLFYHLYIRPMGLNQIPTRTPSILFLMDNTRHPCDMVNVNQRKLWSQCNMKRMLHYPAVNRWIYTYFLGHICLDDHTWSIYGTYVVLDIPLIDHVTFNLPNFLAV